MRGNKKLKLALIPLVLLAVLVGLLHAFLRRHNLAVLDAKGPVAEKERNLFYFGLGLSAIVVIPVYILTILIVWKYRESNHRPKKYRPDWDGSRLYEGLWWGIPWLIILVLSVVTWNSSQALDPYKKLSSGQASLSVEVVAMDWKWLFIYPEQQIASVNLLQLPVNTPVDFNITSDTVMNSFWIPNLGSQIYAMPGMNSELNLMATKPGDYRGSSANISGQGFADMDFTARAGSMTDFKTWVNQAKQSGKSLSLAAYSKLAKPSENTPVSYYSSISPDLYNHTILQYMAPAQGVTE
ncbi:MAG TPA: ubiquinol oxidase subunit II [Candidatus Saccharimonadales bacterium]|nr:ubiquinol oxidase subunit II [Candidatus Saccharimonadales bacterium]